MKTLTAVAVSLLTAATLPALAAAGAIAPVAVDRPPDHSRGRGPDRTLDAPGTAAPRAPRAPSSAESRLLLAGLLDPDSVAIESERTMLFCLVNYGAAGRLVSDGIDDDHLTLAIPRGPAAADLERDGATFDCMPAAADWSCRADTVSSPDWVTATVRPRGAVAAVGAGDTVCFELTGVRVNAALGMTSGVLTQAIAPERAADLLTPRLPVFKSTGGELSHDSLADVREDQHHRKTTSFAELSDSASDAQIPNDVTIDFALRAGDADSVDGLHGAELEESAEILSEIARHAALADAHHPPGVIGWRVIRGVGAVSCPSGTRVLGGGCACEPGAELDRHVVQTSSYDEPAGAWVCQCLSLVDRRRGPYDGTASVVCADAP